MNRIEAFLNQCSVKALCEDESVRTPPTPAEVRSLIAYLVSKGVNPVIVGSVAVFHHLTAASVKDFRPTVDLDVFVNRLPSPPAGWRKDPEAVGLDSWISPSGGYVDFMVGGHEFGTGLKYPRRVSAAVGSPADYPVADAQELLKLKLNSMRDKDLQDAVQLARALKLPALTGLNATQRENYELVKLWVSSVES
jgi:hypothetical protein